MDDWVLLRGVKPTAEFGEHGLIMPKDMDKDVVTEGVAEVISVGPGKVMKSGRRGVMLVKPGMKVMYRGFLRFAHQLGDVFGEEKASGIFMLKIDDILCEVEGPGRFGEYGEYVL
jgi:co-chaperonin GroES (HSP10)